jgi:drug/metabolite transporter (DMT)-like permease
MAVVLMALGAASLFGASSVLMHSRALAAPVAQSLRPGLLVHLARQPVWLAGIGAQLAGFGLQAVALEMGSLALVQTLIPTGLLLALPLAARMSGKRLGRSDWAGAAATVGGLAAFLALAAPGRGRSTPTVEGWSVLLSATLAATGALVVVGRRSLGQARAVALGTAAGTMLAVTAAVTKVAATRFSNGLPAGLGSWEPYGLAIVGLLGLLLMQSSFQAGNIEWSLPTLTVVNPVVSVIVGTTAFHEHMTARGPVVVALAVSLAVSVTGVVRLARSPALVALHVPVVG